MRASIQCDITFDGVRLGPEALLPGAWACAGPFTCLNEARYGIAWGAMGAARDSYEAALAYSLERLQFGKPLAGYQLTQEKLVNMLLEIQKGTLLALHLGRLKDAGRLRPEQISLGKLNSVREASKSPARPARSWAATASPWTIPRCGTPQTWNPSAPTRARTRCTRWSWASTSRGCPPSAETEVAGFSNSGGSGGEIDVLGSGGEAASALTSCPDIQRPSGQSRKAAVAATSAGVPTAGRPGGRRCYSFRSVSIHPASIHRPRIEDVGS